MLTFQFPSNLNVIYKTFLLFIRTKDSVYHRDKNLNSKMLIFG